MSKRNGKKALRFRGYRQFQERLSDAPREPPTPGQVDPKRHRKKQAANRFRHDIQQLHPSERLHEETGSGNRDTAAGTEDGRKSRSKSKSPRREKSLERSKFQAEKSGEKLEQARDKLARQKPRKRLGPIRSAGRAARYQSWRFVHGKIHQVEHENVGTEAAHKSELAGERVIRGGARFAKRRIRARPTRQVQKWERKAAKANANHAYRQLMQEHPHFNSNPISRMWQKRTWKKQHQKNFRTTARNSAKAVKKTGGVTKKIMGAIGRSIRHNPKVMGMIAIFLALVILLQSCMGMLTAVGNGIGGVVGGTSYLADDTDINLAELTYTEWETDLQLEINRLEGENPGFDEYRYHVGDISHNPYELMAYLTAVYDDFTFADMEDDLRELFDEQYGLITKEIVETRTETKAIQVGELIGSVNTTAYCSCVICCGQYANGITASGTTATANRTIAVDAHDPIVPMGTKVVINGVTYTVEDTGNLNKHGVDIDIYFDSHATALQWGRQTHAMYLAEGNSNTIEVTTTRKYHILDIDMTARSFTNVIRSHMSGEQLERYQVYMATKGNRQYLHSPFGEKNWLPFVTGYYGYRVDSTTGAKNYHKGIDIGLPTGTEILAGQDGTVTFAGNSGSYGLTVVLEDQKGLVSKYAHCASLSVAVGQTVKTGDVIATVGDPHLHLEILKDGQYLNPLYFAVTNDYGQGNGYTGDPGVAMGDGSFAAMLAEAEKYLGYPYVWGGSSPSTSFDCSGYISWVINQSGVGNVGRQTAQGLYNLCTPVSPAEAKPGDLIFFVGTYSTTGVSHVGLYVGNGQMIHCGNPIQYASINTSYWQSHFFSFGRLP